MVWKEAVASTSHGHISSEGEEGATTTDRGAHILDRLRQRPSRWYEPAAILLVG
jgi:hypothetical protein